MIDVDLSENIYKDMFAAMQKLKLASSTCGEQCIEELDSLLKEAFKEEISKSVSSNFTDTTTSENEPIEENFKNEENKKDFNATETVTDSNTNLCAKTSSMFGTLYVSQCPVNLNSKHKKKGEFPSYINLEEFVDVPENEKKWDCYNQLNEQPNEKIVIETPIQNTIERNSTCQEPDKVGVDFFEKEKLCDLSLPPPHLEKFPPPINKIDESHTEVFSSVESSIQWNCCELPERLLLNLKKPKILSTKDLEILTTYCWCSYYAHKELSSRSAKTLYLKRLKDLCQKYD